MWSIATGLIICFYLHGDVLDTGSTTPESTTH
jgi:hypothetical protein